MFCNCIYMYIPHSLAKIKAFSKNIHNRSFNSLFLTHLSTQKLHSNAKFIKPTSRYGLGNHPFIKQNDEELPIRLFYETHNECTSLYTAQISARLRAYPCARLHTSLRERKENTLRENWDKREPRPALNPASNSPRNLPLANHRWCRFRRPDQGAPPGPAGERRKSITQITTLSLPSDTARLFRLMAGWISIYIHGVLYTYANTACVCARGVCMRVRVCVCKIHAYLDIYYFLFILSYSCNSQFPDTNFAF